VKPLGDFSVRYALISASFFLISVQGEVGDEWNIGVALVLGH